MSLIIDPYKFVSSTTTTPLVAQVIASGDRGGASPGPTTIVTSSISPGTDCALVLLAGGTVNNAGTMTIFDNTLTITSSGSGPTWTRQAYGAGPTSSGYKTSGAVFTAVIGGSDPGSFTVTIDFNASIEAWNYSWTMYKCTGHNTSTPFTGAVGTKEQTAAADHATPVVVTLAAAPTVDDITLAISTTNTVASVGARQPGINFSQTYGYWTIDATIDNTKELSWGAGQRTGSTSTSVEILDTIYGHGGGSGFDSGQAAINVKAASPRVAPGPLTATLLHTGEMDWFDTAISGFTTPSITPGANSALVLLVAGFSGVDTVGLFSDDPYGGYYMSVFSSTTPRYWTRQAYAGATGNTAHGAVFTTVMNAYDPGTFTVTLDFRATVTSNDIAWALYKITGQNVGFPFSGAVATGAQAGNGAVTPVLTTSPASGDITLAISIANAFNSTGSTPGATFGSTYGTWTMDDTSDGTQNNAWVVGQRTGSTSTNVEFSDVNAHNSDNYSSGQAAIIVKSA